MSAKPLSERQDALHALIAVLVEWHQEYCKGEPNADVKRTVSAALIFLGWI